MNRVRAAMTLTLRYLYRGEHRRDARLSTIARRGDRADAKAVLAALRADASLDLDRFGAFAYDTAREGWVAVADYDDARAGSGFAPEGDELRVELVDSLRREPEDASADTEAGYFGIGIVRGKTAGNDGVLWRSAAQLGAAFTCTIGARHGKVDDRTDATSAWRNVPAFAYADFGAFAASAPRGAALVGVEMGGEPLDGFAHPERCVYLLGAEDEGLSAAARRACLDLLRLRAKATTPAATRLLDAAAAALAADAALLGDRDGGSDDERAASDVDLKISPAIEADGGASRRAKARRDAIARALPLVAAPAATAFGAALLHAAEANRTAPRFAPRVRAESSPPSVAVRARRALRESRPLARVSTIEGTSWCSQVAARGLRGRRPRGRRAAPLLLVRGLPRDGAEGRGARGLVLRGARGGPRASFLIWTADRFPPAAAAPAAATGSGGGALRAGRAGTAMLAPSAAGAGGASCGGGCTGGPRILPDWKHSVLWFAGKRGLPIASGEGEVAWRPGRGGPVSRLTSK